MVLYKDCVTEISTVSDLQKQSFRQHLFIMAFTHANVHVHTPINTIYLFIVI